jgi:signal transduction histidine kinase
LFVDAFRVADRGARLWRGSASTSDLRALTRRFIGPVRSDEQFAAYAASRGFASIDLLEPDADFVHFVETLLAGAIGTASAGVMVSTAVREEPLRVDEVLSILDEASQVIAYSRKLEEKSQELERTGQKLTAANDRLRAIDRMKDDFLSTVTHELRTPLASIRALSEILLQCPEIDSAQRTHFLKIIVQETERLTRLINQVLDLAMVKAGRMAWNISDVNIAEVIEQAVSSIKHLIDTRNISLSLDLEASVPNVRADRDRLLQVVLNLLSNAVKFCDSTNGRVGVVLRAERGSVRVEVWDNGRGIQAEDQDLIFERFTQLTDPVAGKPEGSGLGLAISNHIIRHIGGQLWVASRDGMGARFTFSIPAALANGGADDPLPVAVRPGGVEVTGPVSLDGEAVASGSNS